MISQKLYDCSKNMTNYQLNNGPRFLICQFSASIDESFHQTFLNSKLSCELQKIIIPVLTPLDLESNFPLLILKQYVGSGVSFACDIQMKVPLAGVPMPFTE